MKIVRSRTFQSGNSEAVRLPKDIGFGPGVEVEISREGDTVTIRAKPRHSGRDLVDALNALPKPDYVQVHERIEFPERPGL